MLALLADGLGTGEIAGRLYLSESTAKTHITHIYQKLGAANRAQALVTAMRLGLLDHAWLSQRSERAPEPLTNASRSSAGDGSGD